MAVIDRVNYNDTTPAAPTGRKNVQWQLNVSTDPKTVSANVDLPPEFSTNGVDNGNQTGLDIVSGDGITVTNSGKHVTITQGSVLAFTAFHGWGARSAGTPGDQPFAYSFASAGDTVENAAATATVPVSLHLACNAGSGGSVEVGEYTGTAPLTPGTFGAFQTALALKQTAHSRCWVLALSNASGSALQSDAPSSVVLVGFRYSTSAADTNWQCLTDDGTTTHLSDSGVAADTSPHTFRVARSGGGYSFFIDGAQVAAMSADLPAAGTGCFDIVQFDAPGGSSFPGLNLCYMNWWSRY